MDLDKIKDILHMIREHELAEFEYEHDGLRLRVKKGGHDVVYAAPQPMASPLSAPVAVPPAATQAPTPIEGSGVDLAVIKAPLVGTFYAAAEPGARAFANVGDQVRKDQVLCIIEAMKLMNEIKSDCDGEVSAVYVQNGQAVQFGERLFAIKLN
jgi:acetyl-CoA carboxylase biotin carboxyl carrier protein